MDSCVLMFSTVRCPSPIRFTRSIHAFDSAQTRGTVVDLKIRKQLRHAPAMARTGRSFIMALLLFFSAFAVFASGATNHVREHTGGITYERREVPEVPWTIHIVKMDRSHHNLQFETTLGGGDHLGMGVVSEQVKTAPTNSGRALAAINGDFFKSHDKYPGDPEGLQIVRGEVVSAPAATRSCFWIDVADNPRITNVQSRFTATLSDGTILPLGLNEERTSDDAVLYTQANGDSTRTSGGTELVLTRGDGTNWLPLRIGQTYEARVSEVRNNGNAPLSRDTMVLSAGSKVAGRLSGLKAGDTVKISTATTPDLMGAKTAIGGGPALVHSGKGAKFSGIQPRHPRTALGWNDQFFYLVEVDGRQKSSAGMTFPELTTFMLNLGCDEALNLDGGGSATIWVYGHVMNNPSEGQERPAANALIVVRKDKAN